MFEKDIWGWLPPFIAGPFIPMAIRWIDRSLHAFICCFEILFRSIAHLRQKMNDFSPSAFNQLEKVAHLKIRSEFNSNNYITIVLRWISSHYFLRLIYSYSCDVFDSSHDKLWQDISSESFVLISWVLVRLTKIEKNDHLRKETDSHSPLDPCDEWLLIKEVKAHSILLHRLHFSFSNIFC